VTERPSPRSRPSGCPSVRSASTARGVIQLQDGQNAPSQRSTSITLASTLLQGSPPLSGASVLSASRFEPLVLLTAATARALGIEVSGIKVSSGAREQFAPAVCAEGAKVAPIWRGRWYGCWECHDRRPPHEGRAASCATNRPSQVRCVRQFTRL
jgi:hypothetical protein